MDNRTQRCKACWVLTSLSTMKSVDDLHVAATTDVVVVGLGATTQVSTTTKIQLSTATCVMYLVVRPAAWNTVTTTQHIRITGICMYSTL